MRSWIFAALLLIPSARLAAQNIGINANGATPNTSAILDIDVSALVGAKKGLLIPRVTTVERNAIPTPATSLLVFNTTSARFEYFDGATWVPFVGGGTLDQAYDFGGAGAGRTITADAGAVLISGTDGLVGTGTLGSGALAPAGAGTRMVWNPNKGAFRAGTVSGAQWDNINIAPGSVAMGTNTRASGNDAIAVGNLSLAAGAASTAFGNGTTANGAGSFAVGTNAVANSTSSSALGNATSATGTNSLATGSNSSASGGTSTAMGSSTIASGAFSTAMGVSTTASGDDATALGQQTIASGESSTAMGRSNTAPSFGESVLGVGATTYTPSVNGVFQFRAANSTDRLLVVGNAIDANNSGAVDAAERSDALVILKNGNTGLGTSAPATRLHVVGNIRMVDGNQALGRVLTSDANGTATWQTPSGAGTTLDGAYDFGGAGVGRTITADAGAVLINGTDGLISTGTPGSGVLVPTGAGTRMVWNPNKGAFRAGTVSGAQWDDVSVGLNSVALGESTQALGTGTTAMGGNTLAGLDYATAMGSGTIASGIASTAMGAGTNAVSTFSTAMGNFTTASGRISTVMGFSNSALSMAETVLGIGATTYAPTSLTQFGAANATDRLLVVGNAIDANNNFSVDPAERSNALVILKNGNTGLGTSTPADRLHVVGNIRMVDGNQALGRVMVSNANGTATWVDPLAVATGLAWTLTGNAGTNPATNFVGTTDAQPLRFRSANTFAGNIANTPTGLVSLGLNAGPANTGLSNTFVGGTAGVANTTGGSNTFVGQGAGAANTTTSNNTYVGTGAGQSNTTGQQNVYIGRLAGGNGISGSDNILIGNGAGIGNTANNNVMVGSFAGNGNSTGGGNTFLGGSAGSATTTGGQNTFVGTGAGSTNSTGTQNTLIGNGAAVNANNLTNATAIGRSSRVDVNNGLVLGSVNGINAATSTSLVGIGTTAPLDRLHVVGNIRMVDGNQALGRVLTSDANGTATWQTPSGAGTTLDGAYDFGGAGVGRTITADAGAVLINGTDGLVSTGTIGSGVLAPTGAGTRMVYNPNKAAFRAGGVSGTQWDDANIGVRSIALGSNTVASGLASTALGSFTDATGTGSTAMGLSTTASGATSSAFGNSTTASGEVSTAMGRSNTAPSYGETVLGIGATTYVPSSAIAFGPAQAADRLLVVGNAIDANGNIFVDLAERSDALVILKNGNAGHGVSAPVARLQLETPANATQTQFTQGLLSSGLLITTNFTADSYTPGLFWNTTNNNATKPKAGIYLQETNTGSFMYMGTSNNYSTGITNNAVVIDPTGNVGIGATAPAQRLHVNGTAGTPNVRLSSLGGVGVRLVTADANGDLSAGGGIGTLAWAPGGNSFAAEQTLGTNNAFELPLEINGVERMRLKTTGALWPSMAAASNTAFGQNTGVSFGAATGITAIGANAGAVNTASNNTFVGTGAGDVNTTGTNNTFLGINAGGAMVFGSDCTFLGSGAGALTTGTLNTFVGSGSGALNTNGIVNTFIGNGAGDSNVSGSQNVMIGGGSDVSAPNLDNAVAIGRAAIVGASNCMVLGSAVPGQRLNVGIGITTPLTTLDMEGALTIRQNAAPTALTIDNQLLNVGNVGHFGLSSNTGVIGARTLTLSDGLVIGQLLIITNIGLTGNFEVADDPVNRNTNTPGNRTINTGDVIVLIWGGNFWNEVSFGDN